MSKLFRKNKDDKKVNLETSKEINDRVIKKENQWSDLSHQTTTGAQLQQDLVELLVVNTGRRDDKWIEKFIEIKNACIKLDIWEGLNDKYNLHRGFTSKYV